MPTTVCLLQFAFCILHSFPGCQRQQGAAGAGWLQVPAGGGGAEAVVGQPHGWQQHGWQQHDDCG
jgi:hypothetical protein